MIDAFSEAYAIYKKATEKMDIAFAHAFRIFKL